MTGTSSSASVSAKRIDALTRQLSATPLAVSTKAAVMAELARERAHATFAPRAMTFFLDGGEQRTQYREEMMTLLESFPELAVTPASYDLTLAQRREATLNRVRRLYQLFLEHGTKLEQRNIMADLAGVYDLGTYVRNGVHFGLFVGALMSQADTTQQDEWLGPAITLAIFGSFAMTELGHGSYTRGLETTATFDRATDEFVIHTPTDTATKWWIGAAAETATHTICFAQLVIDGVNHGVQSFFVQLRDVATHAPLAGIRIGDCGAKMGLDGVDNGWIQFDRVRVPRFHMLRRFAAVSRDGQFTQRHKPQMAYAALIGTRGKLVTLANGMLKKALTIAIRYCATRRQGESVLESSNSHAEAKLLDYQSHQYRLMPLLAQAFAYHFQSSYIEALTETFDDEGGDIDTDVLADIHGTMAGLKAFSTWDTLAGIDACRQACGGTGYSMYNGLAGLLADFSVMVTFEGDNTVMALQTANYLVRSVDALASGQKLSGSVQYLERVSCHKTQTHWQVETASDLSDFVQLRDALDVLAGTTVLAVAAKLTAATAQLATANAAWNACHVALLDAARVHVVYNVATRFLAQVETLQRNDATSQLVAPLDALCRLFVLDEFDRRAAFYLKSKYMTPAQCELVHDEVIALCARVRLDAVALVDAFNLRDVVLQSSIGNADGNIYEHILEVATAKTGRSPYFESAIKPMLEGEQLP